MRFGHDGAGKLQTTSTEISGSLSSGNGSHDTTKKTTETKTGTWRKEGKKIILTTDGKDTKCDLDGELRSCADGLVFKKAW